MSDYPFVGEKYAFGVCRIEPENNIFMILEAFAQDVNMPLVMVGNWSYEKYGVHLRQKYSERQHIHLLDPIYEQEKLNELRAHCTIYIHGHSCGGTNPSLVEAMYLGLPIVAFDVNFNRETTEGKALYFHSSENLKDIITSTNEKKWREIGKNMLEIAQRRYTWQRIAKLYADIL